MVFQKLPNYFNLFIEKETWSLYSLQDSQMQPVENGSIIKIINIDFEDALNDFERRLAAMDEKIKSGEITCNIEDPENCENCGS
jgi:hypothetical protein